MQARTHPTLTQIQQAALNTDPNNVFQALNAALQNFATTTQFDAPVVLALLNTLGDLSITVRSKMGRLYQADPQQMLNNPVIAARLREICYELLQPAVMSQIRADLLAALDQAHAETQQQKAAYAQQMQQYLQHQQAQQKTSVHRQSALDENNNLTEKFFAARRDKALYDIPVIGHFLALLLHMDFIVPLDEELYARGFKYNPPAVDAYKEHLRAQHGNRLVFPDEGAGFKLTK